MRLRLSEDIANCVAYNPFGQGDNSAAAAIPEDMVSEAELEQFVVSGYVSGDTSSFFNLPAGWSDRSRWSIAAKSSSIRQIPWLNPRTFYNAPDIRSDPFEVKEAFAEIRLPI